MDVVNTNKDVSDHNALMLNVLPVS